MQLQASRCYARQSTNIYCLKMNAGYQLVLERLVQKKESFCYL